MTEKEKMLNSQMYNAMGEKQLRNERCTVKNLCREYNNLPFEDEETQKILIKKIVGSTKENFCITAPFWCDYGYNIELGENFYSNHNMVILDCAKVKRISLKKKWQELPYGKTSTCSVPNKF